VVHEEDSLGQHKVQSDALEGPRLDQSHFVFFGDFGLQIEI